MFLRVCQPGIQVSVAEWTCSANTPISSDLDLDCMRAKELYVWILMIEEGKDQTPRLWTLLYVEKFCLKYLDVLWRYA